MTECYGGDDPEAGDCGRARGMIVVHGNAAAAVARDNARATALAGQIARAKSWIRVPTAIQRRQACMS